MNPRERRLTAENDALRAEFTDHPSITVVPIGWHPADQYRVTYRVPGVALDANSQPVVTEEHVALVRLGERYPRARPTVVMETAVFHPNFGPNPGDEVAYLGDTWSAARTISDVIVTVGEMIQFQAYDVQTPLNGVAAQWVIANPSIFPIGQVILRRAQPPVGERREG